MGARAHTVVDAGRDDGNPSPPVVPQPYVVVLVLLVGTLFVAMPQTSRLGTGSPLRYQDHASVTVYLDVDFDYH